MMPAALRALHVWVRFAPLDPGGVTSALPGPVLLAGRGLAFLAVPIDTQRRLPVCFFWGPVRRMTRARVESRWFRPGLYLWRGERAEACFPARADRYSALAPYVASGGPTSEPDPGGAERDLTRAFSFKCSPATLAELGVSVAVVVSGQGQGG
jgi:hypothetical protein